MEITSISAAQVADAAIHVVNLEQTGADLFSEEMLCASILRAASFTSPTTRRKLRQDVVAILRGLQGETDTLGEDVASALRALVSNGDLLEIDVDGGTQIFLGPPSYVALSSGAFLLIGVRPDGEPIGDDALLALIEFEKHIRIVRSPGAEKALKAAALQEIPLQSWLSHPRSVNSDELLNSYRERLQASGASGLLEGIELLDPDSPTTYYRGRWRQPRASDGGSFLARRPRAYGANLWCFVEIDGGETTRVLDLPALDPLSTGRDEGWRLQAAVDADNGHPQLLSITSTNPGRAKLNFYSPIPSWAQRYLDTIALPVSRSPGCLFGYVIDRSELEDAVAFLKALLWTDSIERTEQDPK